MISLMDLTVLFQGTSSVNFDDSVSDDQRRIIFNLHIEFINHSIKQSLFDKFNVDDLTFEQVKDNRGDPISLIGGLRTTPTVNNGSF
ncbi:hypothetical protein WICPIJ_005323 [Wickerhamomyces pijperi]|uniref:Uncharacterized protein n=1 Tax=Wickerhamomyces pijperi TaxID=599730 RepID=A0A9P8TM20_WICPI|nr:hypothetical protein WICPIJ_005323 [Wickerhamomyces pijperi]